MFETALGHAAGPRPMTNASFVEPFCAKAKPSPSRTDAVLFGNLHVLERNLARTIAHHRLVPGGYLQPRTIHVDEKAGYAASCTFGGSVTASTCAKSAFRHW